jgi:multidrug efflux pump subunit AcrA (membrane-fusion protein)
MRSIKPLLLIFALTILASCQEKRESYSVQKQNLTLSVYASANVQSKDQYRVFATVTGIVKQIHVKEGDTIATGETIMLVDNTNPALSAENAQLQLNLARENLKGSSSRLTTLKLQLDVLQQRYQEDSINFSRQQKLWDQGIGSKIELENRAFALKSSRSNFRQMQQQIEFTEQELSTLLKQAENNYEMSLKSQGDFEVKSMLNGRVYALYKEPGELVNLQEPVALVGDANEYVLSMEIDEQDIVMVKPNQQVLLRMDAFKDRIFDARVSRIYPLMNQRTQTFLVEAVFAENIENLFPGMSGEANIIIEQKPGVLYIPLDYLINDQFVATEESEEHPVKTGIRTLENVEILEGLKEGDVILKPIQ